MKASTSAEPRRRLTGRQLFGGSCPPLSAWAAHHRPLRRSNVIGQEVPSAAAGTDFGENEWPAIYRSRRGGPVLLRRDPGPGLSASVRHGDIG